MRRSRRARGAGRARSVRCARRRPGSSSGSRSSSSRPMTRGDWRAAGCSSRRSGSRSSRVATTAPPYRSPTSSVALRSLPARSTTMRSAPGALTLDQVAAAAEFATPESDAELARVAVGKPPSAIGLVARTLAPPVVADDQVLYARRASELVVRTRGRREAVSERPVAARAGRDLRRQSGHRQQAGEPRPARRRRPRVAAVGRRRARHTRPERRR